MKMYTDSDSESEREIYSGGPLKILIFVIVVFLVLVGVFLILIPNNNNNSNNNKKNSDHQYQQQQQYLPTTMEQNIVSIHSEMITPPMAEKIDHVLEIHGNRRVDPYYWLKERENQKVVEYLEQENKYCAAQLKHTEEFRSKLYDEMLKRIKQTDITVPYPYGDYFYYQRTVEGKQYRIYCRKKGNGEEQIILDHNKLAEGHEFSSLGIFEVSPNHNLLAYSHDTKGDEYFTVFFVDLQTGTFLPDSIPNTYFSFEWASDNATVFYTTLDHAHRSYRLYRHKLGEPVEKDELVYQEDDERFSVSISKTRDERYLLLEIESQITSEVWILDPSQPSQKFALFLPRQNGVEYNLFHQNDRFLIVTNQDGAKNFKLMEVLDSKFVPGTTQNWVERIPHRLEVRLHTLTTFKDYLVIWEREDAVKTMKVQNLKTSEILKVSFTELVYVAWPQTNKNYDTNIVRFTYTDLITPESVYDYNMVDHTRKLLKENPVLGGYDRTLYVSKRLYATAKDGRMVPISVVHKKTVVLNGENPCFLYCYGAYGHVIEPIFSSNRLSLLERDFVYVIAHVRGGGALGRLWYEDGKLLKKKNTFTDFIACAQLLIDEKYTNPSKLVIQGESAGGLTMGAVLSMAPQLFKAAVLDVPFLDVVTTMLDSSIPLTVTEYEEWGNPNEKEFYDYMVSYSPYDNIGTTYPNLLVITALNDPRVMYWEPAKFIAKVRALKSDKNIALLRCYMEEGHAGASGRYDQLKEIAFLYSFVLDQLGIKQ